MIIYVVNSESRTLSRINTDTNQAQNAFATLGIIPNKVIVTEDFLWSVNSGDNAVQKINLQTGSTIANILIEAGSNPWDACFENGFLYVTGLFTNKVYKVNTHTNAVESSLTVGISPEALCAFNGKLYVTNTGGYNNNYANSSVSVIDLSTFEVTNTIPVSANPQYIVEQGGLLHVSCTGNWINTFGKVCIINPVTETVIQTLNIGGSLGGIWVKNSQQALVGDGNGLNLYQYNPESFTILNDPSNPLSPGGSVVWGNADFIAVLSPNWGSNGKVRLLHPDFTLWKEYAVGLAPTDLKFLPSDTNNDDETNFAVPGVTVYPNPVYTGQSIIFELIQTNPYGKRGYNNNSHFNLSIYNSKGQLQLQQTVLSDKFAVSSLNFGAKQPSGIYLYRIETEQGAVTGKFIILH